MKQAQFDERVTELAQFFQSGAEKAKSKFEDVNLDNANVRAKHNGTQVRLTITMQMATDTELKKAFKEKADEIGFSARNYQKTLDSTKGQVTVLDLNGTKRKPVRLLTSEGEILQVSVEEFDNMTSKKAIKEAAEGGEAPAKKTRRKKKASAEGEEASPKKRRARKSKKAAEAGDEGETKTRRKRRTKKADAEGEAPAKKTRRKKKASAEGEATAKKTRKRRVKAEAADEGAEKKTRKRRRRREAE